MKKIFAVLCAVVMLGGMLVLAPAPAKATMLNDSFCWAGNQTHEGTGGCSTQEYSNQVSVRAEVSGPSVQHVAEVSVECPLVLDFNSYAYANLGGSSGSVSAS